MPKIGIRCWSESQSTHRPGIEREPARARSARARRTRAPARRSARCARSPDAPAGARGDAGPCSGSPRAGVFTPDERGGELRLHRRRDHQVVRRHRPRAARPAPGRESAACSDARARLGVVVERRAGRVQRDAGRRQRALAPLAPQEAHQLDGRLGVARARGSPPGESRRSSRRRPRPSAWPGHGRDADASAHRRVRLLEEIHRVGPARAGRPRGRRRTRGASAPRRRRSPSPGSRRGR